MGTPRKKLTEKSENAKNSDKSLVLKKIHKVTFQGEI